MGTFTESTLEQAALEWLASLGYAIVFGAAIASGKPATECDTLLSRFISRDAKVKGEIL